MKLGIICAAGIGILVLAVASGGAWYALSGAPAPVLVAKAETLPLSADWHSVDNFLKQQTLTAEKTDTIDQVAMRAERQAALRRRLQPPLLPLTLVADYEAKASPKSHWGDGADTSLTGSRPSPQAPLRNPAVADDEIPAPKDTSLVSDHARETVAMLEAFRAALQKTGGAEKFKAASAVMPYTDQ